MKWHVLVTLLIDGGRPTRTTSTLQSSQAGRLVRSQTSELQNTIHRTTLTLTPPATPPSQPAYAPGAIAFPARFRGLAQG